VRAIRLCLRRALNGHLWCNVRYWRPARADGMSTRTTRPAENLQVEGETERLERLVQNVRNLQTGCTVHTGDDTNFSFS
jgi:hypothetical protein